MRLSSTIHWWSDWAESDLCIAPPFVKANFLRNSTYTPRSAKFGGYTFSPWEKAG
jgi:hypothetical protein